jgi:hypothetical protein
MRTSGTGADEDGGTYMTKIGEKLADQMAIHLVPGEHVIAVAVVEYKGSAKAPGYLVGGFMAVAEVKSPVGQARAVARFVPPAGRSVWALTNHRMLFCKATLGNGVGAPHSSMPLSHLSGVQVRPTRIGADKLELTFADGTTMPLDLRTGTEAEAINRAADVLFNRPPPPDPTRLLDRRRSDRATGGAGQR